MSHPDEGQQDEFLVAFGVDLVEDLRGVGEDEAELLYGIGVTLQTCEDQAFVVQVTQHIHRLRPLLESNRGSLYHLQGMLIALGLDAQLCKVFVQGTAQWIGVQ